MAGFAPEGLDAIRAWLRGWVDSGRLASAHVLVACDGEPVLSFGYGGTAPPIGDDTVVRIHSMTKPISAVAALQLIEHGQLRLHDPVSRYIPSFAGLRVNRGRSGETLDPVPATTPMTVWHLLTHTAGFTYGEGNAGAVSRLYEEHRCDFGPGDGPLAEVVARLARLPLLFEPGTAWNYGVASDVLGRVIEVAAGRPLDEVIRREILEPLGMGDTTFRVGEVAPGRLAPLHEAGDDGLAVAVDTADELVIPPHRLTLSGGGGLLSTSRDYFRFAEMLRRGGTLDGATLLRPETVAEMTRNQLPGDLEQLDEATFGEVSMAGVGWGYGLSVVTDPDKTAWRCAPGEFGWGGYASTAFWIDPVHDVTVVFITQLIPSDRHPLRGQLRGLVADAWSGTP